MAEDDFFVAAAKFKTVEISIKERVRHLFGVDISVIFDNVSEDRFENAQVHLSSTSNSAKCKAQIYLHAALEEGKTFLKQRLSFNAEEFKMLLHDYDNIERRSQTVLMYLQDKNEISIQGSPNNVALAQYYINDIINRRPNDIATDSLIEDHCEQRLKSSINDNNNVNLSSSLLESMNKLHLTAGDRLCARGSEHYEDFTTLDSLECDSCLFASPPIEKKNLGFSVESSSSCSSPENETDKILLDPEHSSYIEKALRLGYSEIQIAAVLKKLGTTVTSVHPNTLLSELIKQGAMTPDLASNDSTLSSLTNDYGSLVEDSVDVMDLENADDASNLKHIVIDGSNVAMSHGNKEVFSCRGIQLAVDYFRKRGHQKITVFVPQWRKESSRPDAQINDQEIIRQLEKEKVLVFTPSRRIGGRRVVCYDDRFILELAHAKNGIVVSNDNYRDLHNEKSQYKIVSEEQLLQYVFVDDRFMPPEDPLGKYGPTLDNFLRIKRVFSEPLQPCPYGKKCTYGNKCRFAHPERGNKPQRSVTDLLSEQSNQKLKDRAVKLEEKRKKDITKKKQLLRRTKSLFPDEPSYEPRTHYQSESISEDSASKNTSSGSIKPDLNDMLNEHRLKLDEAIRKSREASPVPTVEVKRASSLLNQSSLINLESQVIELEPFRSTPILSQNSQTNQERLVSGHLDLAKKLSDDAQDTSFFVSEKGSQSPVVSSTQQHGLPYQQTHQQFQTSGNRYVASPAYPSHPGLQQEPAAAFPYRYQAPRATPVEYGTCFSGPSTYMRPNPSLLPYEEHIQSYPFAEHDTHYMYLKNPWDQHHPSTPSPVYSSDHLSIGSRQSYPEHLSPTHQNSMMRQNCSSDPQINQVSNYPRQEHDMNRIRDRGNKVMSRSTSVQLPPVNQHNVPYSQQVNEMLYPSTSVCTPRPQNPFNQAEWGNVHQNFVNPYGGMPPMQDMLPQRQSLHPQVMPIHHTQPAVHQLDTEITPKDARYGLYTQLCGLFSETKVRTVMNKYPSEKDPQILCAYIISIN